MNRQVMGDSVLERYVGVRSEKITDTSLESSAETPDNLGAFGYLRGTRERALMLEMRKKDGGIMAVGYSWLERAEYDPTDGIMLSGAGQRIHIQGRNLNVKSQQQVKLFQAIVQHRVVWIREACHHELMMADEHSATVDSIEW